MPSTRLPGMSSGQAAYRAPAPAAAPKPKAAPRAAAPQQNYYSQPSYNAVPVYSAPQAAAPAPAPVAKAPTIKPEQDATYLAQLAALKAAMSNYNTDYTNQTNQYNVQYGDALKNLGWAPAAKGAVDDPSTPNVDESLGAWNMADQNTAAGRGFTNQQSDFAGRGLLQSSYYAKALNDLQRSLNDQRNSVDTAKSNYLTKLASDKTQFTSQNTLQQQNARADALARIAASYTG